jgi:hypothetical protein
MDHAEPDRSRQTAERRLLSTLARLHRREPLAPDIRVDTLVAELRAAESGRPAKHRGGGRTPLSDAELRGLVNTLVERGALIRQGHRVRLPGHLAVLPDGWRERADELISVLRAERASPPRADAVASRLGLPDAALANLRATGELVVIGPGIDLPGDTFAEMLAVARRLADDGTLSVAALRTAIGTSRRVAAGIIGLMQEDETADG